MVRFLYSAIFVFVFSCAVAQECQIVASGGMAYRLFVIPDSLSAAEAKHQKDLKPGNSFGFDVIFMYEQTGWGIGYSTFRGRKSLYNEEGSSLTALPSYDQVVVNFFSLNYYLRKSVFSEKLFLNGKIGLGYVAYKDYCREGGEEYTKTSGTYGISSYIGLSYMVSKHFLVGANLGLFISNTDKIKVDGVEQALSSKLRLTRVESNVCLGYIF
ncbi:MAG TPA: hypothetical protein PK252_00595 [Bacteroidales bacterium]|nr:hypothetical protein [Bacteroidales bacterium]